MEPIKLVLINWETKNLLDNMEAFKAQCFPNGNIYENVEIKILKDPIEYSNRLRLAADEIMVCFEQNNISPSVIVSNFPLDLQKLIFQQLEKYSHLLKSCLDRNIQSLRFPVDVVEAVATPLYLIYRANGLQG